MYKFKVGDKVSLKKAHACGNKIWLLQKNGVDVTIKCLSCGRIVKLNRREFAKRIVKIEEGEINES